MESERVARQNEADGEKWRDREAAVSMEVNSIGGVRFSIKMQTANPQV